MIERRPEWAHSMLDEFDVRTVNEPLDVPGVTAEGWPVSRGRPEQAAQA
jgi:hypothetical protein